MREQAGIFDVSHMGEIETTGPDAEAFLQRILQQRRDEDRRRTGRSTACCAARTGASWTTCSPTSWGTTASSPSPTRPITRRTSTGSQDTRRGSTSRCTTASTTTRCWRSRGPLARGIVNDLTDGELPARFRTSMLTVAGAPDVLVCGTGYTGEDGVELLRRARARDRPCGTRSSTQGVTPAGLGARDTLRLEVCFHLYGNDLMETRGPIEAGLGWCCKEDTGFIGSDADQSDPRGGPQGEARAVRPHRPRDRPPGQPRPRRRRGDERDDVPEPERRHRHGLPAAPRQPSRAPRSRSTSAASRAPPRCARSRCTARRPDRGRRELPRRPQVPPRARLGADRRRQRPRSGSPGTRRTSSARSCSSTRRRSARPSPRTARTPRSSR